MPITTIPKTIAVINLQISCWQLVQ